MDYKGTTISLSKCICLQSVIFVNVLSLNCIIHVYCYTVEASKEKLKLDYINNIAEKRYCVVQNKQSLKLFRIRTTK